MRRIRRGSQIELYEVTEALPASSRRHAEYRRADHADTVKHFDTDDDARLLVPAVQDAITREARKAYPEPLNLVIYADFFQWVADVLSRTSFTGFASFQSVHVLCYQRIVRLG